MKTLFTLLLLIPIISFGQGDKLDSVWYKQTIKTVEIEAKPVYIKASSQVMELRDYVKLAKKGLLKRADVVKKFNAEVGGYFGYEKTFEGVDKSLIKKGDAYPEFLYLKEKARLVRLKAAEMKYNLKKTNDNL